MKTAFRRAVAVLVALGMSLGPLPAPGRADEAVAKIKKIVDDKDDKSEVAYPTRLVQLVTEDSERDVTKDMAVGAGEAVLTRSARTHVQVEKEHEAYLYSNTFVRFDDLNVWLLRNGAMYVVSKRGRLEIVAEALGRILVNSKVLLRSDGAELFAFVTEGRVVLEAAAHTLSLGPGQAGRMIMGGPPERAPLDPQEQARISKELEATEKAMKGGGGGGGLLAALVAAGVVVGAAAVLSGGDDDRRGGGGSTGGRGDTGGSGGSPDLTPVAGKTCRFDDGRLVVSVGNRGQGRAAESTAEVELKFAQTTSARAGRTGTMDGPAVPQRQQLRIGKLDPGEKADLTVDTGGAWISAYRLTVDREGRVTESNERNNTATVRCPPPVD